MPDKAFESGQVRKPFVTDLSFIQNVQGEFIVGKMARKNGILYIKKIHNNNGKQRHRVDGRRKRKETIDVDAGDEYD